MVTTPLTATNAERLLGGLQGRKEQPLVTGKRAWEVFSYGSSLHRISIVYQEFSLTSSH